MRLNLIVIGGKKAGMEIPISMPKCVIGRGEDCHIRPQSELVSRRHCVILTSNGSAVIEDCVSANGTLVNGEKIQQRRELRNSDRIKIGPLELEVRMVVNGTVQARQGKRGVPVARPLSVDGNGNSQAIYGVQTAATRTDAQPANILGHETGILGWLDGKSNGHGQSAASGGGDLAASQTVNVGKPRNGPYEDGAGVAPLPALTPSPSPGTGEGSNCQPAATPVPSLGTSQGSHGRAVLTSDCSPTTGKGNDAWAAADIVDDLPDTKPSREKIAPYSTAQSSLVQPKAGPKANVTPTPEPTALVPLQSGNQPRKKDVHERAGGACAISPHPQPLSRNGRGETLSTGPQPQPVSRNGRGGKSPTGNQPQPVSHDGGRNEKPNGPQPLSRDRRGEQLATGCERAAALCFDGAKNRVEWDRVDLLLLASLGLLMVVVLSWLFPLSWPEGVMGVGDWLTRLWSTGQYRGWLPWAAVVVAAMSIWPGIRMAREMHIELDEANTALLAAIGIVSVVIFNFWYPAWGTRGKPVIVLVALLSWLAVRIWRRKTVRLHDVDLASLGKLATLAAVDLALLCWFLRGQGVMIMLLMVFVCSVRLRTPCGVRLNWDDLNLLLLAQIGLLTYHTAKFMLPGMWLGPRGTVAILALLLMSLFGIRTYRLKAVKLDEISLMLIVQVGWIVKFLVMK